MRKKRDWNSAYLCNRIERVQNSATGYRQCDGGNRWSRIDKRCRKFEPGQCTRKPYMM